MSAPRLPTRFDPEISHQIERLAARAWPADETADVEGWLLRRTEGVDRRRSNSLLPPAEPGHAARTADLVLATAEELGFAPTIQVSPAESHQRLDETLTDRGMTISGGSLVLAGEVGPAARPRDDLEVSLTGLTAAWVAAWAQVGGGAQTRATAELVLSQLGDRARFATAVDRGSRAILAVALGVGEDGWLGLFSLTTAPAARRRGVASAVVDELGRWATTRDAARIYLQVEADNAAALSLYANRGFHIAHSYHYRS